MVMGLKWDTTSPFFREALRKGDVSAQNALEIQIEEGIDEMFGSRGAGLGDDEELVQIIATRFMQYITDKDVITHDKHEMAEETEAYEAVQGRGR